MSVLAFEANPDGCIIVEANEAPGRLGELGLGLTVEILTSSVETGDSQRKQKTQAFYPLSYPSVVAWAETLAALRRSLIRLQIDWSINNFSSYETVFRHENRVSIAVAGGDKRTGRTDGRHPRLARKRGPMTTDRVRKNRAINQLALDLGPQFEPTTDDGSGAADFGCQTWFLVVYPDKDEVRVELSLASGIDKEGVVSKWIERIILPPVPVSGAVLPIDPHQDSPDDDERPFITRA